MKTITWLDYAVWAAVAVAIALAVFLGYSMWSHNAYLQATSPAARAIKNLEGIVRDKPSEFGLRIRLAEAYAAGGKLDASIAQYKEALKLQKNNPFALAGLGQIAMKRKQWTTAEGYWRQIIATSGKGQFAGKDMTLEQAYFQLGTALMERHEYEESVEAFREAIRIRPDASDTHYILSVAYTRIDMPEKSREELGYALMFDPTMPEANYDLGQLLLKEGKVADAAERFRLSADNAIGVEKPREALAKLGSVDDHYAKAKDLASSNLASATVEVRIAVAIDPQDVASLRLMAQLWERQQKTENALETYDKLAKLLPEDKDVAAAVARLRKGGK